jgi:heme-degrading monooxygenase HmoA
MISDTPNTPYYCVIFSSERTDVDEGYDLMSDKMEELAKTQSGFLGIESARNKLGITVSYWEDLESIRKWKLNADHSIARELGKSKWYNKFKVRICKVERDYGFEI